MKTCESWHHTWRLGEKVYRRALKTEVGYVASEVQRPDGSWVEVGPEGLSAHEYAGVDEFLRMLAAAARAGGKEEASKGLPSSGVAEEEEEEAVVQEGASVLLCALCGRVYSEANAGESWCLRCEELEWEVVQEVLDEVGCGC